MTHWTDTDENDAILGRCVRLAWSRRREAVENADGTWAAYAMDTGQPDGPSKPTPLEALLAWIEQGGLHDE